MTPAAGPRTRARPAGRPQPSGHRGPLRSKLLTAAIGALLTAIPLSCTWTSAPSDASPAGALPASASPAGEAAADPRSASRAAGDPVSAAARAPTETVGWLLAGIDDVAEPDPGLVAALHIAANEARVTHGARTALWDDGLARAARQHAAELAARNVLDHLGLDPERRTVADRLARAGSPYTTHAENLAAVPPGFDAARATVDGWLESPGHRANLLWPDFDRVGYGTALGAGGTVFVTQVLAQAPWVPVDWSTTLVEVSTLQLTLQLIVDEPSNVLIEIDGAQAQRTLEVGTQGWSVDVSPPGPWEVLVGVPGTAAGRFTIDDAGSVSASGRWSPDERRVRPREIVRVRSAAVEPRVREVVRLQLALPTSAAELVVGSTQVPGANRGAGLIAADLELADGDELLVGLAAPGGDGLLAVRHRWLIRRDGASILWAARP